MKIVRTFLFVLICTAFSACSLFKGGSSCDCPKWSEVETPTDEDAQASSTCRQRSES